MSEMQKQDEGKREKERFLLIDGSSLLFRAFFAIRGLSTRDGVFTNAVYGFLTMYKNALEKVDPDYVLVAFDRASSKDRRAAAYEDYKGNRQKTPDELLAQFGLIKEVLDALKVQNIDLEGYEADDIIGTLAHQASAKGLTSYLLTGDRDYFQLVDENTQVLFTKKGISQLDLVTLETIRQDYGIEPVQFQEIKGLQGDASDNIPGVPGIGEKRALQLIQTYGNLEGVYAHIDEISGKKMKENLIDNEKIAYMSRDLGTICLEAPVEDLDLEAYRLQAPDQDRLRESFDRLEFQSLAASFGLEERVVEQESFPLTFLAPDQWAAFLEANRDQEDFAFVLLGDGPNPIHGQPTFLGLKARGEEAVLLPLLGEEARFTDLFAPFFQAEGRRFLSFNIKSAFVYLGQLGIEWTAPYRDLMLMDYLLDANRTSYDLADTVRREFGGGLQSQEELLGKGKKAKRFQELEEADLEAYVGAYLTYLDRLEPKLLEELEAKDMAALFDQVENPLALVLAHMELTGVQIDREALDQLDHEFSALLAQYQAEVYRYAGHDFNLDSPKQLGQVLFEELKLPPGKKTKTGYSTSAEVLEKLRDDHPIVEAILAYRELAKLMSTYVEGFRPYIDEDSRVRSFFKQTSTATGRISSTEPNLQNIPVRTEEGRKLRAIFTAKPGHVLVDSDYSQIELRVLASLAEDPAMIRAFQEGADIHRKTAAEVNHKSLEEVTDLERSRAKAVNFGIIYGISDYGLSQQLGISRKEAQAYIDSYKAAYPQIGSYMETIVYQAKEDGYVTTSYGRRREIPELQSSNFNVRKFGERVALNTPIQGTAADIIKMAMIRVDQGLRDRGFQARLVLQIHDELIVECPEEEAEAVAAFVKETMEAIGDFPVELRADTQVGKTWAEAK